MLSLVAQSLVPDRCFLCGSLGEVVCRACVLEIRTSHHEHCPLCGQASVFPVPCICGESSISFCTLFSLTTKLRKYLHLVKYNSQKNLISTVPMLLAEPQLKSLALISKTPNVLLVPIPLHKSKEKERGFNQARLIAQALSRVTGAPLGDLLVRVKKTKQQAQTPRRSDRNQNTARAFECPARAEADPKTLVVLVDDVITSGSTMIAAAHALRRRGINRVWGLGLAQEDWRGRGY